MILGIICSLYELHLFLFDIQFRFLSIWDHIWPNVKDGVSGWASGNHMHIEVIPASAFSIIGAKHRVPKAGGEQRLTEGTWVEALE